MKGEKRKRLQEEADDEADKKARAAARDAAKDEAKKAKEALEKAFKKCERTCKCKEVPCPMEKYKRCPACGVKKGLCKVQACVAARKGDQPLLLGYNPNVGA